MSDITQTIKDGVNYVSESIQGAGAQASHEANKETAKSSDASLGTRASAAKDSVGDKFDQKSHDTKAEVHKG
ncbi:Glucose-repressible protein [Lachnellula hyalina]|uniref:Glucose-repressible protein n=1 Tax=Lachnellula hyalina TaxID=1316788 RepID=A0A8H8R271_9HELO|nr:Glucose-repressible protein [Lachnellula hyalina]TVY27118.1 Glucose-repressible protein [Lachnellula hyalina]